MSQQLKALHELSISEAGKLLRCGALTAQGLTEHALSRIRILDPALRSFVRVTEDRARDDARRADEDLANGIDRGPMHGIPYALKDVYDTATIHTTCQSKLLIHNVPEVDSEVATRLRRGGGVLLGKLNTFEFAIGGPSHDLPFPPARNPWNGDHTTGGSSSGSAVAVAAGLVRTAMGTDTGGSIRVPAFYCGTVGLKPTYGRVSRRGVFPLSYTLDHCGPLSRTVEDAALTLQVVAGYDPLDPTSADAPGLNLAGVFGQDLEGLRIAYARNLFCDDPETSSELLTSIDTAVEVLSQQGADVTEIILPDFGRFYACGKTILLAEAHAIHEENLRSRPLDYGRYTYQWLASAFVLTATDLVQAFRLRRELATEVNRVLASYDAIVSASVLSSAARLDTFGADSYRWAGIQTMCFNVTGHPAIEIPTGYDHDGLPLGMQIAGRLFDEATVCRIASAYEAATKWSEVWPPAASGGGSENLDSGQVDFLPDGGQYGRKQERP